MPPLIPTLERKPLGVSIKEKGEENRVLLLRQPPNFSLFPNMYKGYPGAPGDGVSGVPGGMLSQLLMCLSARHQRQIHGGHIKEEVKIRGDHLLQPKTSLQHSPEISSTQGKFCIDTDPMVNKASPYISFYHVSLTLLFMGSKMTGWSQALSDPRVK